MKEDKIVSQKDIDEAYVKLKPVFGIKPGVYVALFYSIAIIVLLFFVLFYPGLKKTGTYCSFFIDPPGSAILVDGVYAATAPCNIFVSKGKHTITVERPGFLSKTFELNASKRIFAANIVKPKTKIVLELDIDKPDYVLKIAYEAYSDWSLGATPSLSYQIPMVLSDAARALSKAPAGINVTHLASAASSMASSAASLRDAARASTILYSSSMSLSPVSLGRLADRLFIELSDNPAILASFAPHLSAEDRAKLESLSFYKNAITRAKSAAKQNKAPESKLINISGIDFIRIEPGTAIIAPGSVFPVVEEVDSFMLAVQETTVGEFRRFIKSNPEWDKSNIKTLIARGLASEDYLKDIEQCLDQDVLRYVSRPAAQAYCVWLSKYVPESYKVTLPDEAQWTLAAQLAGNSAKDVSVLAAGIDPSPQKPYSLKSDSAGFKGLFGNVWEWCSSAYSVFPAANGNNTQYYSKDALVKGASWANNPELINLDARGCVKEDTANAYLGFRIALVPRDN